MKILHVLVGSELGALGPEIAEYLADAGHFVHLLAGDPVGSDEWRQHFTHNASVVDEDGLAGRRIDCVVGFSGALRGIDAPVLAPEIRAFGKAPAVDCYLRTPRQEALVQSAAVVGAPSVNALRGALLDVCIDALIHLSREGAEQLEFVPRDEERPHDLAAYLEMVAAAEELAAVARAAERHPERCDLAELMGGEAGDGIPPMTTLRYEIPERHRAAFDATRLEWLGLALQMVLNSRRAGLYGYELHTPQGRIRRYLEAERALRADALDERISAARPAVCANPFYDFDTVFGASWNPRIEVCWDVPRGVEADGERADALLSLRADPRGGVLEVVAPAELPFLAVLPEHLDGFFGTVDRFAEGALPFGALLALPAELSARLDEERVRTDAPYRDDRPIHGLIEEQAARHPDAAAVVCGETTLTYREFNAAANRFARLLQARYRVAPGDLIALYLDRTENLLIAAVAALKLGCAYVPLDLNSPLRRTAGILADSSPALVVSDRAHAERLAGSSAGASVVAMDADDLLAVWAADADASLPGEDLDTPVSADDLDIPVSADDLAYVIYTSGTTGRPKGVAVEHKSYVNIAEDIGRCINFRPGERMLAVTTIAFDISTLEIFMPLLHGGTVVLAGRADLLDVGKLIGLIEQGVAIVQATPSLWHLITQSLDGKRLPVRALCGGEALSPQLAAVLAASVDVCWNVYGPTETTVWSTRHLLTPEAPEPLIGRPVANTRVYVLDEELQPLPPGVAGELYIGGSGLARGYLGAPELTASRFLTPPQATAGDGPSVPEERIYRTGDLVRALPGGELQFIGRNDFQIKLRGHRIELGEIESALQAHPAVEQSLVTVHEPAAAQGDEARFLVGHYVAAEPVAQEELQQHLADRVPDYMVPAVLIHLESMPLNVNGKIDRSRLPDPSAYLTGGYLAPSGELETRLCEIWDEVLGVTAKGGRAVGVTDDFFGFGGNSILGIKLVNKINSVLGCDIRIRDLFREKTIRSLAPLVAGSLGDFAYRDFVLDGTDTAALHEPFPLTNVQQTYYLGRFNSFELSSVSTHVYSEFQYRHVDHARLEEAYNRLIRRHHALRTVITDGQQRFLAEDEVPRYRIAFHELPDQQALERLRGTYSHKLYDPEEYPLFDVVLSRLDGIYRLHISFDALIIDMGSFDILFDEWAQLYADPQRCLPDLGISYRDYVLQYERVRDSALMREAQEYWEAKAEDYHLDLRLPLRARPSDIGSPVFRRKSRVIPAAVWDALSAKCVRHGISPTALVVELFSRVLGQWSGQDRLCMNLTLFNRLPLHPDINGVIGDFTVLELFDYRIDRELGIADKLRRTHGELLQDVDHNLFDGVDFQRLLKTRHSIPVSKIVAPVVLTSTLGAKGNASMFELPLDDGYLGIDHAISQTPQVWLDNKAYETDEGFVAEWDYVEQLFDPAVIDAMHDGYCRLIEQLAALDWETGRFPSLPVPAEDLALIEAANAAHRPASEHTLFSLYESRLDEAGRRQSTAVVDAATGRTYSYDRLYGDSVRLAGSLLDSGALPGRPDTLGVLAEKGYLQVVTTLAVMKAGSAYVPMNVEWPGARIGEVLESAGTRTLLVSRGQWERADVRALESVCRLLVIEDLLEREPVAGPALPAVAADDVAYVIFTSGSTGRPKGVTISHRGAVNTLLAVNERFGVAASDRVLALSELSFDLSVWDLFGTLAAGGTVVFPAQAETKNPAHWVDLVERHGVSVWNSVPQLAGLLVDQGGRLDSLRAFLLSGDWIPTGLPDRIRAVAPDAVVMSLGGATEGSIWSIWYEIGQVDPGWSSIPYGVAMPNQRMYVLDAEGEHCPVGVIGEIHIGGAGVALGYWRDEERTAERYVEHPRLGRLYRTGDLGRWSGAGHIEFIGRNDFQVKLNGYRVELEEIAAKMTRLPGVDRAVARIQPGEEHDRLVGYLVPAGDHRPLTGGGDPDLDKEAFLLGAPGVLASVEPRVPAAGRPDPAVYVRAKSYRHFLDAAVDPTLTKNRYAEVLASATARPADGPNGPDGPVRLGPGDWAQLLSVLTAVELPDRALPKYRYPSAGSSYAVRTFLQWAGEGEHLYHHPLTGELCAHRLDGLKGQPGEGAGDGVTDELQLVVHRPAITPLYGDRAGRLARLEAGHMLALLTEALDTRGVPYRVVPEERRLDDEHSLLCRIVLGGDGVGSDGDGIGTGAGFRPVPLQLACFVREMGGTGYAEASGERRYDPDQLPVFDRTSDVYAILRRARCLLTLEGGPADGGTAADLSAGFLFQRLSERLRADGLGTCPLGLRITDGGVYTMAVGAVDEAARTAPDSPAEPLTLTAAVTEELARALPDYMLPSGYAVLDALPLSANGKLAADRLPPVEFTGVHVEPSTDRERALAAAWAEILGRPATALSANDSFFSVGGNSLAAMKLVRLLQRDLGIELKLRDLYQNDTIIKLAEHIGAAEVVADREEGEL
ncbi:amino acid adenylation domain-containing protein [Streptomyces sp. NPDC001633]|uniref:amino acid adenylation domain-containing protein n=1 Tax=Streptomyces sp. NPDC001633 TaxID=3364595 RepID=UPI00369C48AE